MADGSWLYAVACSPGPTLPADLRGVAGERVRALPCAELTAMVGRVDLAEFGEEPLRRALTDPGWVERVARAHHQVVETVARLGATVPFRLATIYLDDERVRDFVFGHRKILGAGLRRVTGHAEWGVKAYATPSASAPTADDGKARDGPGLAYLTRRREELHRRERTWAESIARADVVHAALVEAASAVLRHPVRDDEQSDDGERLVLNAAYLVGHADAGRFTDAVRALAATGTVRLHVTGPWAAYSFADVAGADPT